MKMTKCKICKREDDKEAVRLCFFNIDFKAIPICELCADSIFQQELSFNINNKWKTYRELKKEEEKQQK